MNERKEKENFNENHENYIKKRMIPLVHRTVPYEITDETRFNNLNPKLTIEELTTTNNHDRNTNNKKP